MSIAVLVQGLSTEPRAILVEGYRDPGAVAAASTDVGFFEHLGYDAVLGHSVPLKLVCREAVTVSIEEAIEKVCKDRPYKVVDQVHGL